MPTIQKLLSTCSTSQGESYTATEVPYLNEKNQLLKSADEKGNRSYYDSAIFQDGEIYRDAVSRFNKETGVNVASVLDIDVSFFVRFICDRYSNAKWAEKHCGKNPKKLDIAVMRVVSSDSGDDVMLNNVLFNAGIPTDKGNWSAVKDGLPASLICEGRRALSFGDIGVVSQIMPDVGLNQIMATIFSGLQKTQDSEILNAADSINNPELSSGADNGIYSATIASLASNIFSRRPNISEEEIKLYVSERLSKIKYNIRIEMDSDIVNKFENIEYENSLERLKGALKLAESIISCDKYKDVVKNMEDEIDDLKKLSKDDPEYISAEDCIRLNDVEMKGAYTEILDACQNAVRNKVKCLKSESLRNDLSAIQNIISKSKSFAENAELLKDFSNISVHGLFAPNMDKVYSMPAIGRSFSSGGRPHLALKINNSVKKSALNVGCLEDLLAKKSNNTSDKVNELCSTFGKHSIICKLPDVDIEDVKNLYQSYRDAFFEPKNYFLSYSAEEGFKLSSSIEIEPQDYNADDNSENVSFSVKNIITDKVDNIEIPKADIVQLLNAIKSEASFNEATKNGDKLTIGNVEVVKNENEEVELRIGDIHILGEMFYNKMHEKYLSNESGKATFSHKASEDNTTLSTSYRQKESDKKMVNKANISRF